MKKYFAIFILLSSAVGNAQTFINASFESWGITTSCGVNTSPDSWTNYTNGTGIDIDEANFSLCPTTIPSYASNGIVYARASARTDTTGEGMFQNVTGLLAGNVYLISFDYAGSNLYPGSNDIQWHIFIDDIDISETPVFHSNDSIWSTHSFSFTATATTHKIGFRAYTAINPSPGSAGIDNLAFINTTGIENYNSNSNFLIFPVPVHDKLNIFVQSNELLEIIVFDISSRIVLQQKFANSVSLSTEHLPKGLYLYEVRNKDISLRTGKILKD